jgi:small subunit ribosomal protein S16
MLMIRLQRTGKKHQPSYRLVLVDSRRATKSGSFIEILGSYDVQKGQVQFKNDKIKEWIGKGAQVSDTVHNLLVREKIIDAKKRDVLHHNKIKKIEKKEEKKEEPQQAESVEAPAEL